MRDCVLFINHGTSQCGVYQYGKSLGGILQKSKNYQILYKECNSLQDLLTCIHQYNPVAIIFNHHPSTLPWLPAFDKPQHILTIGAIHEVQPKQIKDIRPSRIFDHWVALDPTVIETEYVSGSPCMIREFSNPVTPLDEKVPIIGSLGFGFNNKGYSKLVTEVQNEFDAALIRLHIPFATFGDANGQQALTRAAECKALLTKPNIRLEITHDFRTPDDIYVFYNQNDVNAFLYDEMPGRGLSGAAEFALAAHKPLWVTKTTMFRHLFGAQPSIFYGEITLKEVLANGMAPLLPYYEQWSQKNLIAKYENILERLL
jgi:hypothetical protein